MYNLRSKYYVKRGSETYTDITSKFDGVRILKIDGLMSRGEPVNIYNEQWNDTQEEDFMITTFDLNDNPVVITKNTDIKVTFIVSERYAINTIDVAVQHDAFVDYMTNGALWIKSYYTLKETYCACLEGYEPTNYKFQRGRYGTYIIGELTLHQLQLPTSFSGGSGGSGGDTPPPVVPVIGNLYIGIGGATLSSQSDIENLTNLQYRNVTDDTGDYSIVIPSTNYLWICTSGTIAKVISNAVQVPMNSPIQVGDFYCYRSTNKIIPHTMYFSVTTT